MTTPLYVAAGGGGDVIAAAVLASVLTPGATPCIVTYSWDRLMFDPLPGPRSAADFSGLVERVPGVLEITTSAAAIPPAGSTLPQLAAVLPARLFLIDPHQGTVGMRYQLTCIADHTAKTSLTLVDAGGDLVARGDETELRSPLADTLALAACIATGIPTEAVICGPGLDGELSETQVIERLDELAGTALSPLTAEQAKPWLDVLRVHPTEVTGLWLAAARGYRGTVEIRDRGLPVELTDRSAGINRVSARTMADRNLFATALSGTTTLAEVENVIRSVRGATEIDYERHKATRSAKSMDLADLGARIAAASTEARARGAAYLSVRRLIELLELPGEAWNPISAFLTEQGSRLDPPLWSLH